MKIACEHVSTWNAGRYTVVSDSYFTKETCPTEQLSEQTVGMLCNAGTTLSPLYANVENETAKPNIKI